MESPQERETPAGPIQMMEVRPWHTPTPISSQGVVRLSQEQIESSDFLPAHSATFTFEGHRSAIRGARRFR